MGVLVLDGQVIHYEVLGQGEPVLFLHGWMGSWRYWWATMENVAEHFRTYSFDFWGFGDSDKQAEGHNIDEYVEQVVRFLDGMGIARTRLVGHSMGGMVALKMALAYPERVVRVATAGAVIEGSALAPLLKLTSNQLIARFFVRRTLVTSIWTRLMQNIRSGWRRWFQEVVDDSAKGSQEAILGSVRSMRRTDLRPELASLKVPALIIHGSEDDIVDPDQAEIFEQIHVPMAQVVVMENCRHFPFMDDPQTFNRILLDFLCGEIPALID
ncbi:MAG: alpha/beta hydrolase [Chloroflexia bacterium]|nr:alpha/beta hydrolase [Chloroflexia bacterium]